MSKLYAPSLFISGVATGAGKTFLTRGLALQARRSGARVAALKPMETGVHPQALDALALGIACGRPELAHGPGFYRAHLPLAPYAAALEAGESPPTLPELITSIRAIAAGSDVLFVEGAGGLLVPIDRERTMADLALALDLPVVLVAADQLGVLSSVLTCVESALARRLPLAAVILSQRPELDSDPSPRTNQRILQERLPIPVLRFPSCTDDDAALADGVEQSGLIAALRSGAH